MPETQAKQKMSKANSRRQHKKSYRAHPAGLRITEKNKVTRLFSYLQRNPGDKAAREAYDAAGGNLNKLTTPIPAPTTLTMRDLASNIKFSKRTKGENFTYILKKAAKQERDFHATYMTPDQLKAGITRARNRMRLVKNAAKAGFSTYVNMYVLQIAAYQSRLIWYAKG